MRVAVIGGGISGLSCAHRLLELKRENNKDFEILLFEKESKLGGTIETVKKDGFVLEMGPDSFLSEKPWGTELCKKLEIDHEVIGTKSEYRRSFVARNGKLISLPEGFYLIAPTNIKSFLKTPLFSLPGKLRMMLELFTPKQTLHSDESVGSFIRRRFGREALERVGQPMLAGIYTGDPELLSLSATMPRFQELEKKYGSVTKGLLQTSKNRVRQLESASGPRYSLFLSFKEGMQTLTRSLSQKFPPGMLRQGVGIKEVVSEEGGVRWKIILETGQMIMTDVIVSSTPACSSAILLKNTLPVLSEYLNTISYESVATLNMAYSRDQIGHLLDGFGFVVPKTEKSPLVACSFVNQKFENRAPQGTVLLRAFVGGAFGRDFYNKNDQELINRVHKELSRLLQIKGEPLFSLLKRCPNAMVQYRVGHLDLVAKIEKELEKVKGLFLIGSSYRGVGIPDCIHEAHVQAEKINRSMLC